MVTATDTGNVIEDNTVVGNTNGIFLVSGVQGNIFRSNIVTGNPAVQVSIDNPSGGGVDIKNLSAAGANAFEGNVCGTSINAPCPSVGPSLTADPNPIPVTGNVSLGQTTISWSAPDAQVIEIHIGSPTGPLFTMQNNRGSIQTGLWVSDGLTFYLQDVTGGNPLTSDYTLATLVVHLQSSSATNFHLRGGRYTGAYGASAILLGFILCGTVLMPFGSRGKRVRIALGGAVLLALVGFALSQTTVLAQPNQTAASSASSQDTARQPEDRLERMIAAGSSPKEIAQYLFDTHGCKNCHTIGQDGKLGFTEKGKERGQGFEGCIRMLTAMTVIAQTPVNKRSPQQRQKAERFQEFGCTACHKLTPGKLGLTEVGAKLAHLHLGCVGVEKLVASGSASQR